MPLLKSPKSKLFNVKRLMKEGKPGKQAVAIALELARKANKNG